MMIDKTLEVPVKPGGFMESQSGIQRRRPRIFARLVSPIQSPDLLFVLVHPTSNFHSHYLIEPLVTRGAAVLAVNTRYVANDSVLLMERAIQDLGTAICAARSTGARRIILIGNSGGGSLAALYIEQAERLTIRATPDGRPIDLQQSDLPMVDGLALVCAHTGRADQLLAKIDPAVTDERCPDSRSIEFDMFHPSHRIPYDREWIQRYRIAQAERLRKITAWVLSRLRRLEEIRPNETADEPFLIHRTQADPRLLDLTLDKNDRRSGSIQGSAIDANLAANGLARFCTLRSFLSQWSPDHTHANGPRCLSNTRGPVLIVEHTADQTVFPTQIARWVEAAGPRGISYRLKNAPHYLDDQPALQAELCDLLIKWALDS